jgi:hypothetical protein
MRLLRVLAYIFSFFLLFIAGLAFVLYLISASGRVQTFIAQQATNFLSKRLETKVAIHSIKLKPFKTLNLSRVYIEDQQGDTLFYLGNFDVDFRWFNRNKKALYFNSVALDSAQFNLISKSDSAWSNLQFFTSFFSGEPTDAPSQKATEQSWLLQFSKVDITNSTFVYHNLSDTVSTNGINFSDLRITDINLEATRLNIDDFGESVNIRNLSLKDKSGFEVQSMAAITSISDNAIGLTGLKLLAGETELNGEFNLLYADWDDFSEFSDKVEFECNLFNSKVSLADVGYFVDDFQEANLNLSISGSISGPLNRFKVRNLQLGLFENTSISGNITFINLTDLENLKLDANLTRLETNYYDLKKVPLPPFAKNQFLEVPENVKKLGDISLRGTYLGSFNNFQGDISLNTSIGNINTNIAMWFDPAFGDYHYDGILSTSNFYLNEYYESEILGPVSAKLSITGKGLKLNNLVVEASGNISRFNLNGYNYKKIKVNGNFKQNFFEGDLKVDDDNFLFDFAGKIDFNEKTPQTDFTAQLFHWNLAETNFDTINDFSSLAADLSFKTKGKSFITLSGEAQGANIKFCAGAKEYDFEGFSMVKQIDDADRKFLFESSVLDLSVFGDFNPEKIGDNLQHIFHEVFPEYFTDVPNIEPQNFILDLSIKEIDPIFEIFFNDLKVPEGGSVHAGYKSANLQENTKDSLFLSVNAPQLVYKGTPVINISAETKMVNSKLTTSINARNIILSDSLKLPNIKLKGEAYNNYATLDVNWLSRDSSNTGFIPIRATFLDADHVFCEILPGYAVINNYRWELPYIAQANYMEQEISISHLSLTSKDQNIFVNGHIGPRLEDRLRFEVENLGIGAIAAVFYDDYKISGSLNSSGFAAALLDEPIFVAVVEIQNLLLEDTDLGDISLGTAWRSGERAVNVNGQICHGKEVTLNIEGSYQIADLGIDLNLTFENQPLDFINPFTVDIISETTGFLNGRLTVTGNLPNIESKGLLDISEGSTKVDYLGTTYKFEDKIRVEPDWIGFDRLKLTDERGNTGFAVGTIIHEDFADWNFDVSMNVENFMALNNTELDNDLFYGAAFVSGNINVSGFANKLDLTVDVKSEAGTRLNMPLGGSSNVELKSFVRFVSSDDKLQEPEPRVNLDGITMNFKLDVRDNAQINLIFDETIGDVLRASGNGVIEMVITPTQDFFMYGTYTVAQGSYLFTLRNLINKRFRIAPGGTIKWFGDPLAAELDLATIYNVRVPLYDIILDNPEQYRRRVPVEVYLKLKGALTQPEISFDIQAPTVDENARAQLKTAIAQDDERNRQVFSLLLLNKFLPVVGQGTEEFTGGASGAQLGAATTAEMLSNQLSNWVNQISTDFDIGINYRPGDAVSNEEIAVALSTQFFNDRLNLSGNFGVSQGNDLNQNPNSIVGDFLVEYLITEDGRFRLKVFNESNDYNLTNVNQAPYTQGVGVFYQQDFDTFEELVKKVFSFRKKKEKQKEED